MKKKFLSLLLAICLILPCAIFITGCNKKPEATGKMTETEWKESIMSDNFVLRCANSMVVGDSHEAYEIELYKNEYTIIDMSLASSIAESHNYYYKKVNGGNTSYEKNKEEYNGDWQWVTEEIDATTYESNLTNVLAVIDFVKNNQAKFTFGSHSFNEGEYCYDGYKLDIAGSEIETDVANLKTQLRLTAHDIGCLLVSASPRGTTINFIRTSDGASIFWITFNTNIFSSCTYDKMFKGLTNYTITGGPSNTHVDYVEMKVVDNGMYFSNPNAENNFSANYFKEFYTKDNKDGTYSRFIPNQAGGWVEQPYQEDVYTSNLSDNIILYLGEIGYDVTNQWHETVMYQYFERGNDKLTLKKEYDGTDKTFTINKNALTYTYSKYEITVNDSDEIISMAWDMQFYNAIYDAYSEVYHMSLTVGNTTIEYPDV